jgi:hypothetical protein
MLPKINLWRGGNATWPKRHRLARGASYGFWDSPLLPGVLAMTAAKRNGLERVWRLIWLVVPLIAAGSFAAAQTYDLPGAAAGGRLGGSAVVDAPAGPAASAAPGKAAERLREGTRLTDEVGAFQFVGDRVAFSPGGNKDSYRVLENLALERISRALSESRGQRQWVVSGVITEFRGTNYLLVTKAIIQLQEGDSAAGP